MSLGPSSDRHDNTVRKGTTCDVYPQLTPAFFVRLARLLPESCQRYIFSDPAYEEYLEWEDDDMAYNEPYCQWLLGYWDAVLLPKCTQWIARASIDIDMFYGSPHQYQTACLIHALSCMSGVAQLTLWWSKGRWSQRQYHLALLSLSELTAVLPKLASLHITRTPLFPAMVESLLTRSRLQHLRLGRTPVYGLGRDEIHCKGGAGLFFNYPHRWPDASQLIEQRADEKKSERRNRRLRLHCGTVGTKLCGSACRMWEMMTKRTTC